MQYNSKVHCFVVARLATFLFPCRRASFSYGFNFMWQKKMRRANRVSSLTRHPVKLMVASRAITIPLPRIKPTSHATPRHAPRRKASTCRHVQAENQMTLSWARPACHCPLAACPRSSLLLLPPGEKSHTPRGPGNPTLKGWFTVHSILCVWSIRYTTVYIIPRSCFRELERSHAIYIY